MHAEPAATLRQDATLIGLIAIAHGLSHFFQLVIAVMFPLIREDLGVSYAQLGAASALYFTTSAIAQTFAGFVSDRFGPVKVLHGGLALCALGILIAGLAPGYAWLLAGAAIAGIGNSVFHPVDFSILNARVTPARLPVAYSVHGFCGAMGWTLAPAFAYGISTLYGWRAALLSASVLGVVMIVALLVGGIGREPERVAQARRSAPATSLSADLQVFMQTPVLMCFLYFVLTAVALTGMQTFGVSSLMGLYSTSVGEASTALSAYLFSSGVGILGGGYLATRFRRADRVAALGVFSSSLVALVLALGIVPLPALAAAMALGGFLYGLSSASRDLIVREATPKGSTGKVYGFVYSGLDLGQMVMPVFYGWMLDLARPDAVFYVTFFGLGLAVLTVLRLPLARKEATAAA